MAPTPRYLEPHFRPNSRLTIVLIHPFWGQASVYLPLLNTLDYDFDALLIHDPFFGTSESLSTIRQYAQFYLHDAEKQIPLGREIAFGGFSFGGLVAFEMASLWSSRHGKEPASLILLDAGTFDAPTNFTCDKENEITYALQLFGKGQEKLIRSHFEKLSPILRNPVESNKYNGTCLYLSTKESAVAGASDWWTRQCPKLHTHQFDCAHYALLDDFMVSSVGSVVNQHCRWVTECLDLPANK
ncbi:hypothetical protein PISL3812_10011 [Talaromyces islandicus]|uniref:Thioesterase domain-containing protein n=1 Tax=Talaromyces islandicus TaxID=28573 RepID=A0A0U1MBG4_TALIS|nr:hypothetical protein PISL3812_10011 [Talaromyces islandicus]